MLAQLLPLLLGSRRHGVSASDTVFSRFCDCTWFPGEEVAECLLSLLFPKKRQDSNGLKALCPIITNVEMQASTGSGLAGSEVPPGSGHSFSITVSLLHFPLPFLPLRSSQCLVQIQTLGAQSGCYYLQLLLHINCAK